MYLALLSILLPNLYTLTINAKHHELFSLLSESNRFLLAIYAQHLPGRLTKVCMISQDDQDHDEVLGTIDVIREFS